MSSKKMRDDPHVAQRLQRISEQLAESNEEIRSLAALVLHRRARRLSALSEPPIDQAGKILGEDEAKPAFVRLDGRTDGLGGLEGAILPQRPAEPPVDDFAAMGAAVTASPEGARGAAGQRLISQFGRWVRQAREERRWTLETLAEQAGMTPAQISLIERGLGKHGPSLDVVARLLLAFGFELVFAPARER
jgi:DNA-binding XRE family transcriptional regulator